MGFRRNRSPSPEIGGLTGAGLILKLTTARSLLDLIINGFSLALTCHRTPTGAADLETEIADKSLFPRDFGELWLVAVSEYLSELPAVPKNAIF